MPGLFISLLQTNPTYFFAVVITVVISVTLHELAHGWAAMRLGDDTPHLTGHMTLNPFVHMGGMSIVLLLIAGIAFGAMPVNWSKLRGKYAGALVAAAGPAMNLLLAGIGLVGLGLWMRFGSINGESHVQRNAFALLWVFAPTNLTLLMFNLLPLPPLDGSTILANLVPAYRRLLSGDFARGAMVAIFFALFLGGGNFINRISDTASIRAIAFIAGPHPEAAVDATDDADGGATDEPVVRP